MHGDGSSKNCLPCVLNPGPINTFSKILKCILLPFNDKSLQLNERIVNFTKMLHQHSRFYALMLNTRINKIPEVYLHVGLANSCEVRTKENDDFS